jgi:hypothetical protein
MVESRSCRSATVAERQVLLDAILVGLMHQMRAAQAAAAFGAFALAEMTSAGAMAQDLAGRCDLEPLAHGLFGFDTFGTSHKINFLSKRARNIGSVFTQCKR